MSKKSCKIKKDGGVLCVRLTKKNAEFIERKCLHFSTKSRLVNSLLDYLRLEEENKFPAGS